MGADILIKQAFCPLHGEYRDLVGFKFSIPQCHKCEAEKMRSSQENSNVAETGFSKEAQDAWNSGVAAGIEIGRRNANIEQKEMIKKLALNVSAVIDDVLNMLPRA